MLLFVSLLRKGPKSTPIVNNKTYHKTVRLPCPYFIWAFYLYSGQLFFSAFVSDWFPISHNSNICPLKFSVTILPKTWVQY